ncbi:hypothetical protein CSAL01_12594 [Colletotrichum salicis]|uniref:PDZ domain-containing protein n=1 Tax=Colletotrichum salicis TaxID=1209931 RepID=A0A135V951_9PEZI|nr:hypothetical protein CSAL01_12594 [Colletotrichum salicis]
MGAGAPSHDNHPSSIKAYDSQGHFPINIVDSPNDANLQEWHGLRNTEGDLSLHLHVQPVQVTAKDHRRSIVPLGLDLGRTELLEDQGGLMGAGKWFGQRGPDYFRATLNGFLSAYYTSPHLTTRISQGPVSAQVDSYTASIPYNSGWIYMLKMDCYTRRASVQTEAGALRPLDGVVGDLMEKRRSGLKMQTVDWLKWVAHWLDKIGIAAAPYFQETIMDGNPMWLDDMTEAFGAKEGTSRVVEVDQEMLCFGFDVMKSLERGVVFAIEPGSRAKLRGLRDGDRILRLDGFEFSVLGPDREVKVLVERDGETHSFEYSPRGFDEVPCWQILKVEPAGK